MSPDRRRYRIDTYGLAKFKALLAGSRFEDPPATTETRFQAAFGRPLASVWDEWRGVVR